MHCIVAAAVAVLAVLVLVAVVVAVARVVVAVACCCLHLILLHIALLYFFYTFCFKPFTDQLSRQSSRQPPLPPSFSSPLSLAYSFSAAADSLLPATLSSLSLFTLLVLCNNYNSKIIDALHKRAANSFLR